MLSMNEIFGKTPCTFTKKANLNRKSQENTTLDEVFYDLPYLDITKRAGEYKL